MSKRLIRYSNILEMVEQLDASILNSNCSIVLKDGKVYTGKILSIDEKKVVFKNMRHKSQEVSSDELSEIIADVKLV